MADFVVFLQVQSSEYVLSFGNSLLHLRGLEPPEVPLYDDSTGNILAFNGIAFLIITLR